VTTSILLSSYNGEKYIYEQLTSLLNQSIQPDEVVIIDDASTDNTPKIINDFIKEHNLFGNWKFFINQQNKGWRLNFIEGVDKTSSELVLFCDQDDVWLKNKLSTMLTIMQENSDLNVLVSPYISWYGEEKNIENQISSDFQRLSIDKKFKNYNVLGAGCTMIFRRKYFYDILPYYSDGWAHDDFLWKMSLFDETLGHMKEGTVLRRFHNNNASRLKRTYSSSIAAFETGCRFTVQIEKYIKDKSIADSETKLKLIRHKYRGYENRLNYFKTNKINYLFQSGLKYSDQYRRKRQFFGDWLLVNKHKND
jgi:glycosyltransferase involved in cell wall biosynthesis